MSDVQSSPNHPLSAIERLKLLAHRLFTLPPATLRPRLSPWLLGFALGLMIFMFILPQTGVDMLVTYGPAGRGQFVEAYIPRNPRFAIWLFWLFARLPWKWDYLAIMAASILILLPTVQMASGRYWKVFLSFPFIWLLGYGQIDAFIALGFALSWWTLAQKRYWLMGVGFALACMLKPQLGLFAILYLWLLVPNREKWKPLIIPTVLVLLSLLQWGWDWPLRWGRATLEQTSILEANWANASPFQVFGVWGLLVWIPVLLIPMDRLARLRCILAATAFSLPYFPAYEMLFFLIFPVSLVEWALTGLPLLGSWGYAAAFSVPLVVVLTSIAPWLAQVFSRTPRADLALKG